MRRADRLFQIIQLLQTRRLITAEDIAQQLEVSTRTIYRDIQDLSLSGVPVISQTGSGYRLDKSYHLPPITFSEAELEALILGARMVQAWSDRELASEATRALQRIAQVLPQQRQGAFEDEELIVPNFYRYAQRDEDLPQIRKALKNHQKLMLKYARADGQLSDRLIWPLGVFFWGKVWTVVGWCELRHDFRQFRVDRIQSLQVLAERFSANEQQTLEYFLLQVCKEE
jgi:predicted DNA-binding transcriptional regulator YafY